MGGGFHAPISRLTELPGSGSVARFSCDMGKCVKGENLDMGVVVDPGTVEDREEAFLGVRDPIRCVHGGQQALA